MVLKYKIQQDNKLHTSYSELKRCTSANATAKVVLERNGKIEPYQGEQMKFGIIRHEQWEKESLSTGFTPQCFSHLYYAPVGDMIERAFAVEIFRDVVLHFRPDSVSIADKAVIDNKKIVSTASQFKSSMQLLIYAYGLSLHGIRITKRVYLCEVWNKESDKIIGYEKLEMPVSMYDIATVNKWLLPKVRLLKATNDLYLKGLL